MPAQIWALEAFRLVVALIAWLLRSALVVYLASPVPILTYVLFFLKCRVSDSVRSVQSSPVMVKSKSF